MDIAFAASEQSSLGVEWELALVDPTTGELTPRATEIFDQICSDRPDLVNNHPHIQPELMLNTIELITGVHQTVPSALEDLRGSLDTLTTAAQRCGVQPIGTGTHPYKHAIYHPVTEKDRYAKLLERTQWWGAQMLIWGVHVHVGLDSVDKVIPVLNGLLRYYPHLQALSANSPYWYGEDTGYASQRTMMFWQLPTSGLPFPMANWADYERCVSDLLQVGAIDQIDEVRWDVRPVPRLGTIEMRFCDSLSSVADIGAVVALTQCLVQSFSDTLDAGGTIPSLEPWLLRENKWRAARYGLEANLIKDNDCTTRPLLEDTAELVAQLEPVAQRLGCAAELASVSAFLEEGTGYQQQRAVAQKHDGDLSAVVHDLAARLA